MLKLSMGRKSLPLGDDCQDDEYVYSEEYGGRDCAEAVCGVCGVGVSEVRNSLSAYGESGVLILGCRC